MLEWIISASVLIVMVMVSRKLLRGRISCWLQYSLWLLVAVRLLVPVSPLESAFSVMNLLPENWTEPFSGGSDIDAALGTEPEQGVTIRQAETPKSPMPDMAVPVLSQPAGTAISGISQPTDGGHFLPESADSVEKEADLLSGHSVGGKAMEPGIGTTIWAVWLTGACLLAVWLLGVNGSFRQRVRRNRVPFTVSGNMQRQLSVYKTDEISTPCMYGLLRPAIYITPQVAEDSQMLNMVLCHEYMHYRHGDHIWSAVRMLCLCIHWYNPLVWAAVGMSRQDGELACDEGVLQQLGKENRKCYGEALLALSTEQRPSLHRSLNLATSMSDTRKQLKERLSALVTIPRMAAGTALLVIMLSVGLIACTFTSRAEDHGENPAKDRAEIWKSSQQGTVSAVRHSTSTGTISNQSAGEADADVRTESEHMTKTTQSGLPTYALAEDTGYPNERQPKENVSYQDYDGDILTDQIYQSGESRPEKTEAAYADWNAETLGYYDEEHRPVAKITEGDMVIKLTYVEMPWSLPGSEIQFSREMLYWACQALQELEQWTGTRITEACYCASEFGDFYFAQTPSDIQHDRIFYSRCYNNVSGLYSGGIENINYSTDMDVWYSPVKQYTTPPRYDKMTTEEILTWYFERSAIAAENRVEEITHNEQGDYIIRTDQGIYYEFSSTDGISTIGKGLSLYGPYDSYPEH